ncbi:hypothetical protein [Dysgonomonas gadei]|uniref:hypothetical protein n=1 Tax=Dysgonomonas gadei TaxID=156974 RepID=UPI0011DD5175|nr:hypothetical protein [Dysgonomonas gadei]
MRQKNNRNCHACAKELTNNANLSLANYQQGIATTIFCPTPPLYGLGIPPAGRGRNRDATIRQNLFRLSHCTSANS